MLSNVASDFLMKHVVSPPQSIYWEITDRCNLNCTTCNSVKKEEQRELSTKEILSAIDDINTFATPELFFSGGEPLLRDDLFEIIQYAHLKGMKTTIITNSTLLSKTVINRLKESGVNRISLNIVEQTNFFIDDEGFDKSAQKKVKRAIDYINIAKLPFQINVCITKQNMHLIDRMVAFAKEQHVEALHFYLLVPIICGMHYTKINKMTSEEFEAVLQKICKASLDVPFEIDVPCTPYYNRVVIQEVLKRNDNDVVSLKDIEWYNKLPLLKGCSAGDSMCFISHKGEVQPCAYLPISVGNIREQSFSEIWNLSNELAQVRESLKLKGKCSQCKFGSICLGCRAKAFDESGTYLAEETSCLYDPKALL